MSVGFPRREYWSGLPFPLQEIFPTLGSSSHLPCCLFTTEPAGKPMCVYVCAPTFLGMRVCRCMSIGTWWFNHNFSPVTWIIHQCPLSLSLSPRIGKSEAQFFILFTYLSQSCGICMSMCFSFSLRYSHHCLPPEYIGRQILACLYVALPLKIRHTLNIYLRNALAKF